LEQDKNADKTLLELGPGESLFTALLAKAYGFNRTILLDVSIFALPALDGYKEFEQWLDSQGLHCPSIKDYASFEEMLSVLNAQYMTRGLDSLRDLPDNSVDFVFSQAVLEHIRKKQFIETAQELWRILKPGGISTHEIDFKDHLEASLNNLRFREQVWEAEWMASSGFYTNRIRLCQMLDIFKGQGFEITLVDKKEWATLPIHKKHLQPEFQALSDADLLTNVAVIRLYKPR
jgi:predicted SAM-dependent methyltransferase